MKEISENVFIETDLAGVTLGVISFPHGLVLVDAPFLPEDIRKWRSSLLNLSGGVERLLISLDVHPDRIVGTRAMDSVVIAHEDVAAFYNSRAITFKAHAVESGSEWETYESMGNVRWTPPELTFTAHTQIHWDDEPLLLEHRPGSSVGALWVRMPEKKLIFLGDSVVKDAPPFLGEADIPLWLEALKEIAAKKYQDHILISSRGGFIRQEHVRAQIAFLKKVHHHLESFYAKDASLDKVVSIIPELLDEFIIPSRQEEIYRLRLFWGLRKYYQQKYLKTNIKESE